MRLDHLLSKEHLPTKVGQEPTAPECGVGVLNGGDTGLVNSGNGHGCSSTAHPSSGGWHGTSWLVRLEMAVNTLLGPERTSSLSGFFLDRSARHGLVFHTAGGAGFGGGLWVVGWLFVENCTVDASIFVVKLSRANGGCLGTRSR